eukprot:TRINITY_DN9675_c0_g1_i2.p1 TRINITY_DN9675_c0_g1~~TRINITY_DN9675_c0_g1_i2.p1  ORF type:complete len:331 (-),score=75.10 TRINITY_DN9675_c0_g1_i2:8-1000(-)
MNEIVETYRERLERERSGRAEEVTALTEELSRLRAEVEATEEKTLLRELLEQKSFECLLLQEGAQKENARLLEIVSDLKKTVQEPTTPGRIMSRNELAPIEELRRLVGQLISTSKSDQSKIEKLTEELSTAKMLAASLKEEQISCVSKEDLKLILDENEAISEELRESRTEVESLKNQVQSLTEELLKVIPHNEIIELQEEVERMSEELKRKQFVLDQFMFNASHNESESVAKESERSNQEGGRFQQEQERAVLRAKEMNHQTEDSDLGSPIDLKVTLRQRDLARAKGNFGLRRTPKQELGLVGQENMRVGSSREPPAQGNFTVYSKGAT